MILTEIESEKMEYYILQIQPYYDKLISSFSKAYVNGSSFYVGDNLLDWWNNYNIRYYKKKKQKLEHIIEIIQLDKKNNREKYW
jgi:hypothetical protein